MSKIRSVITGSGSHIPPNVIVNDHFLEHEFLDFLPPKAAPKDVPVDPPRAGRRFTAAFGRSRCARSRAAREPDSPWVDEGGRPLRADPFIRRA